MFRRLDANVEPTFAKRRQNNVYITLSTYFQPDFDVVTTSYARCVVTDQTEIVLIAPVRQVQPWWPLLLSLLTQEPVLLPNRKDLLQNPVHPKQVHPMYPRLHLAVFHVSVNATKRKAFLKRSRSSTCKTYESSWRRWCSWCAGRKINQLSASPNEILSFLADCFQEGLQYRTINVLRSALSSIHPKIDSCCVGQHPHVINLMRGVLSSRPPRLAYSWNLGLVTRYLKGLGVNSALSPKQLSWKLAILFTITCPKRVSSLDSIDLLITEFYRRELLLLLLS